MHPNDEIKRIVACLNGGGVVLMPTDTVYGLAALPARTRAVARIYALKDRPEGMNLPIMVDSVEQLSLLGVAIGEAARRLLDSPLIPGALTLALGFRDRPIPDWLQGRDEVAVRIPDDKRLLEVLRQTGPLLVTSANRHGNPTPGALAEALTQLDGAVDLTIDGGQLSTAPSTLVNCRRNPPVIERVGTVSEAEIARYL
uniref:L-threonylcarbamoyladenylate synthase n=1 Tax=Candidatus Kentrum sp. DK TaxID=2126562 RepID=A0A450STV6_9GAMM|nr:MAG: L-threonylcarbamoyladenylate synthase [Candidatus Kentron sp. DK]